MGNESGGPKSGMLDAAKAKDGSAFPLLLARFGRFFRWYFIWNSIPEAHAEDVAVELIQDIVLYKIDSFEGDERGFRSWLMVLMRHACANWHRKNRANLEPIRESLAAPEAGEDRGTRSGHDVEALRRAMRALDARERVVLEKRFDGFVSYEDMAAEMGDTPGNLRVRVHRAIGKLKKQIEKEDRFGGRRQ